MRASVLRAFIPFSEPLEGIVPKPYIDTHKDGAGNLKPLITVGMGNMVDDHGTFLSLPWLNDNEQPADSSQVESVYRFLRDKADNDPSSALQGGGNFVNSFPQITIHLSQDGMMNLISEKLNFFEKDLRRRFPSYDAWPADAQLALLSMAWAMGSNFNFPKFQAAANNGMVPDFDTMAQESHMSNGAPKRNAANQQMFINAARVTREGLDPDVLIFPVGVAGAIINPAFAAGQATANFLAAREESRLPFFLALGVVGGASWFGYKYAKKHGYIDSIKKKFEEK